MPDQPPEKIAINHDDHHAGHIGRTADGRQFFLTSPFVPAVGGSGSEFVALYLFDATGNLLEALIDGFGPRATMDEEARTHMYARRLEELGPISFERIEVKPFAVERFGTTFGLIPRPPEEERDIWFVELEPGNYMAFSEPWDSGEYDT
ncbi:MAG: hypothetical protein ABI432_11550 [Flavobacteriales bacterium]